MSSRRRPGETDAEWTARAAAAREEARGRLLVFLHGGLQALTAVGLLQLYPFKPRTVGLLGSLASALNCYFLLPAMPVRSKALPPPTALTGDAKPAAKVA
jgi:hypothetical protein